MNSEEFVEKVNQIKGKTEQSFKWVSWAGSLLIVLCLFLSINERIKTFMVVLMILTIIFVIVFDVYIYSKYKKAFKKLIPLALKHFGDDLRYSEKGIERKPIEEIGMFGYFSNFTSEDTLSGKFSDVNFTSSDVKIGYVISTGKSSTYVPVCHGQLYVFEFNKKFKTKTYITERNISKPKNTDKIKMESKTFNKQFKIYTSNEQEAFYLLTPHFMEKLLLLEEKHKGDLFIAFYESQLYIGIHNNKDRFKVPFFSPFNKKEFENQLEDIYLIKEIIEDLKLNIEIFKD